MQIPIHKLDAFTGEVFRGNPAAVCLLDDWLDDATMLAIAAENNLSETAFCMPQDGEYAIRWFTPKVEMDLAGHPTLAAAWVIMNEVEPGRLQVTFSTRLGDRLAVVREGDRLTMDFPARPPTSTKKLDDLPIALGGQPVEVLASRDGFAVFGSETEVRDLVPNMALLAELDVLGVIATAPGDTCDFVSRFFAPAAGIAEDPVTGSAHCTLIPYWSGKLHKTSLFARQISQRGGELFCEHLGNRVKIGGEVTPFLRGTITL